MLYTYLVHVFPNKTATPATIPREAAFLVLQCKQKTYNITEFWCHSRQRKGKPKTNRPCFLILILQKESLVYIIINRITEEIKSARKKGTKCKRKILRKTNKPYKEQSGTTSTRVMYVYSPCKSRRVHAHVRRCSAI